MNNSYRVFLRHFLKGVFIVFLLPLFFIFNGCAKKPYLISNAFSELGISPQKINRCIVMISEQKITYFLCEPEDRNYRIKIIPSDTNNAVCIILPEQNLSGDYFSSVIEKEIKQVMISVNYSIEPFFDIEILKKRKTISLFIKSSAGEKYVLEGLFMVNEYSEDPAGSRGNLR